MLVLVYGDDEVVDKAVVLCVGKVNPQEELISSAEADKNSAAEADDFDEAAILLSVSQLKVLLSFLILPITT